MRKLVLGLFVLAAGVTSAQAQDAAKGELVFKQCLVCHSIGPGAKNKVGPVLNGLFGRKSGTVEGFSYSEANKNSGITWNEDVFRVYIKDPKAKIPGTKMIFAGVKDDQQVSDLIAFIKQFKADGSK